VLAYEAVKYPEDFSTTFSNFIMQWIAALILHMWLSKDIKQGLEMMKFAVNHRYKFKKFYLGFFAGWL
jgi:hypothetical protein